MNLQHSVWVSTCMRVCDVQVLEGFEKRTNRAVFTDVNATLITAGEDGFVRRWDVEVRRACGSLFAAHQLASCIVPHRSSCSTAGCTPFQGDFCAEPQRKQWRHAWSVDALTMQRDGHVALQPTRCDDIGP